MANAPQLAFKDIYGHGTTVRKDTFYNNQAAEIQTMADVTDKETEGINLRPWLNKLSYDAITNVFWPQTYRSLDRGNDDCIAKPSAGTLTTVNAMHTFHTGAAHSVLIDPYLPSAMTLRLKSPPPEPDLFSNLPTVPTERDPAYVRP
ncbi:hypothetical protein jhhlp_008236 [Lomentospora prolificans]|uniref:Uncharacterized protein n=1 Tax=Lomentospora prolificans TaxID=41688 RepID=A0A2N3MXG9_9PEZI|nr:hypothetical protein jhhlp_008236 [Lomentospora prolificans]